MTVLDRSIGRRLVSFLCDGCGLHEEQTYDADFALEYPNMLQWENNWQTTNFLNRTGERMTFCSRDCCKSYATKHLDRAYPPEYAEGTAK